MKITIQIESFTKAVTFLMLGDLSTAVMTSTFQMTLPMITSEYRVGSKYMAKSGTA